MRDLNSYKSVVIVPGTLRESKGVGKLTHFYIVRPDGRTINMHDIFDGFQDKNILITVSELKKQEENHGRFY